MTSIHTEHHDTVASTQARATELLDAGRVAVVVSTDEQPAGRGRAGRRWQSPPGGALLVSVGAAGEAVQVACALEQLPLRAAECLLDAVREVTGSPLAVWKSPNDLVAPVPATFVPGAHTSAAKVGGVLIDLVTTGGAGDRVIIGAGMNVCGAAFTTSDGRDATTLEQLAGEPIDLAAIRHAAVRRLAALIGLG